MKSKDCKGHETLTKKQNNDTYATERNLNKRFNTFVINFKCIYQGSNTVDDQILLGSYNNPKSCYSEDIEPLPLGENFQKHVACFVKLVFIMITVPTG